MGQSGNKCRIFGVEQLLTPLDPLLLTALDAGEASVIGLSRQLNVNLVLLDERKARKIARTIYGLNVIGSARILVEAKKQGLIDHVGSALQKMRDRGYWIGDALSFQQLCSKREKRKSFLDTKIVESRDNQTSADAYIGGKYNGAFTYYFCKHLRDAQGGVTRSEVLKRLRDNFR